MRQGGSLCKSNTVIGIFRYPVIIPLRFDKSEIIIPLKLNVKIRFNLGRIIRIDPPCPEPSLDQLPRHPQISGEFIPANAPLFMPFINPGPDLLDFRFQLFPSPRCQCDPKQSVQFGNNLAGCDGIITEPLFPQPSFYPVCKIHIVSSNCLYQNNAFPISRVGRFQRF